MWYFYLVEYFFRTNVSAARAWLNSKQINAGGMFYTTFCSRFRVQRCTLFVRFVVYWTSKRRYSPNHSTDKWVKNIVIWHIYVHGWRVHQVFIIVVVQIIGAGVLCLGRIWIRYHPPIYFYRKLSLMLQNEVILKKKVNQAHGTYI